MGSSRQSTGIKQTVQSINRIIAAEISAISKYYDRLVQWCPLPQDNLQILQNIQNPNKEIISAFDQLNYETQASQIILLNGNLNHEEDPQVLLSKLKKGITRQSRILAVTYNPCFQWLCRLSAITGLSKNNSFTFLRQTEIDNLAKSNGLEIVRRRWAVYCPFSILGSGDLLNAWLPCIPLIRRLSFVTITVFRPIVPERSKPSLSIIIPAKNEKGNIENILKTLPDFNQVKVEIIFVVGQSIDGTAAEIDRLIPLYNSKFPISAWQQTGTGKSNAVQLGFAQAKNDLFVILDADLSTPAACLEHFYEAYCAGLADFINGNRLIYPTEKGSMQCLNELGNIFFAKALSLVLGIAIGDSLCGSKLFSRSNYLRFCRWRKDFGDFDPFGDFDLLFPAALIATSIIDIPVHYKKRTYGTTNIHRFSQGWLLLKMLLRGFFKITLGRTKLTTR